MHRGWKMWSQGSRLMSSPSTKSSVQIEQLCRGSPKGHLVAKDIFDEKECIDSGSLNVIRLWVMVLAQAVVVGCRAGAAVSCSTGIGSRGLPFEIFRRPALNLEMGNESSSSRLSPAVVLRAPVSRMTPKIELAGLLDLAIR